MSPQVTWGWLTALVWTLQLASCHLKARTSSFVHMNPHTQVWKSRAGHILANKILGMLLPSEFIFSPSFKKFSTGLIPDYEQILLNHWCSCIILSTFRIFHLFTHSTKVCVYQLHTRNLCKRQGYSDCFKSHGPLSSWSLSLVRETIIKSMNIQINMWLQTG